MSLTTIAPGSVVTLASGHTGSFYNDGGTLDCFGTIGSETMTAGATSNIENGGVGNDIVVGSLSLLTVNTGARAYDIQVESGQWQDYVGMSIDEGGYAENILLNAQSYNVHDYGTVKNVTILQGGFGVFGGATVTGILMSNNGEGFGANVAIASGGTAYNITATGSDAVIYNNQGGDEYNSTINSGSEDSVSGFSMKATINSGGVQVIGGAVGATGLDTTIAKGGEVLVVKEGALSNAQNEVGGIIILETGSKVTDNLYMKGGLATLQPEVIFATGSDVVLEGAHVSTLVLDGTVGAIPVAFLGATNAAIAGFGSHDTIVLEGFSLVSATYVAGEGLMLSGTTALTLAMTGSLANNFVIGDVHAHGTIETVVKAPTGHVALRNGAFELVTSGGVSKATSIKNGGVEIVYAGGKESDTKIAGGTLQVMSGGTESGVISFSGTGGDLVLESDIMPTNVISGFAATDNINLAGIAYVAGATATVATAGTVTIIDGGKTYKLAIAGATVGEDFTFGSGGILTLGAAPTAMAFLRPAAAPLQAMVLPATIISPAAAAAAASPKANILATPYGAALREIVSTSHHGTSQIALLGKIIGI